MSEAEAYDWSQFHVRMYYLASMDEVFARFSTSAGLESFFIYRASHTTPAGDVRDRHESIQAGDRYEWEYVHDYRHGGEFLAVVANERVDFSFGSMHVSVRFREVGEAIEVDLHQTQCATDDPDRAWQHVNCRSCWIYFLTNLRSILAGGPDVRDFEHPNWNDSVSIGFLPGGPVGEPRDRGERVEKLEKGVR